MNHKSTDTSSHKNVVLDFTISKSNDLVAGQPVAILPAQLAKQLLKVYAEQLIGVTQKLVIDAFINNLRDYISVDAAIMTSIEFIQERELIENINRGNWDAYATLNAIEDTHDISYKKPNKVKVINEDIY